MSSPISISININTGDPAEPSGSSKVAMRLPSINIPDFIGSGDPATTAQYHDGDSICVTPSAGSNLGTVAIWFSYDTVYTDVRASVYPDGLAHADAAPPPLPVSRRGQPSNGNLKWTWSGTNELYGADHAASGRLNRVYLWRSTNNGATWRLDPTSFAFYGVTQGTGGCGGSSSSSTSSSSSGSPSPSGSSSSSPSSSSSSSSSPSPSNSSTSGMSSSSSLASSSSSLPSDGASLSSKGGKR